MDEMHEESDAQLLRGYAQHGDEAAFREIVTRHTDLVYSVAVRCVNSPDLACDIAQSVFTDLSSKARPLAEKMADGASLVGWLYRSTRFAALNQLRNDHRRLAHERQAIGATLAAVVGTSIYEARQNFRLREQNNCAATRRSSPNCAVKSRACEMIRGIWRN